ncbi:hypothetical protein DIPPA_20166 [Diplonema papillatum]|nr:hypothetical protein DIPPA_20166 [Diplonema papillatum]|eukprot:gene21879-33615_t
MPSDKNSEASIASGNMLAPPSRTSSKDRKAGKDKDKDKDKDKVKSPVKDKKEKKEKKGASLKRRDSGDTTKSSLRASTRSLKSSRSQVSFRDPEILSESQAGSDQDLASQIESSASTYVGGVDAGDPLSPTLQNQSVHDTTNASPPQSQPLPAASTAKSAASGITTQPAAGAPPDTPPDAAHLTPPGLTLAIPQHAAPLSAAGTPPATSLPPPAHPGHSPYSRNVGNPDFSQLVDEEVVARGGYEVEAFTALSGLAKEMRTGAQKNGAQGNALKVPEAAVEQAGTLEQDHAAGRALIDEMEDDTRSALLVALVPIKDDIVERVNARLKRIRRRQRKIDQLKTLQLKHEYGKEWADDERKKQGGARWSEYVEEIYKKDATRLYKLSEMEVNERFAAGQDEWSFIERPATPSQKREKRAVHDALVSTQRGNWSPEMPPARQTLSPQRQTFPLYMETPSFSVDRTPFTPFGPSVTGPFTPQKVYTMY